MTDTAPFDRRPDMFLPLTFRATAPAPRRRRGAVVEAVLAAHLPRSRALTGLRRRR